MEWYLCRLEKRFCQKIFLAINVKNTHNLGSLRTSVYCIVSWTMIRWKVLQLWDSDIICEAVVTCCQTNYIPSCSDWGTYPERLVAARLGILSNKDITSNFVIEFTLSSYMDVNPKTEYPQCPRLIEATWSYFEFKIRLIRLGLSFQKQKFLYSNSQLTDLINIKPKSQLWMEDTEKLSVTFSHAWLILVEFT